MLEFKHPLKSNVVLLIPATVNSVVGRWNYLCIPEDFPQGTAQTSCDRYVPG